MKITLSKQQWKMIGEKAGWIKLAGGWGRFSKDLDDVLSAQVMINKKLDNQQIFNIIKSNTGIAKMMEEEEMSDEDLVDYINDSYVQFIKNKY